MRREKIDLVQGSRIMMVICTTIHLILTATGIKALMRGSREWFQWVEQGMVIIHVMSGYIQSTIFRSLKIKRKRVTELFWPIVSNSRRGSELHF